MKPQLIPSTNPTLQLNPLIQHPQILHPQTNIPKTHKKIHPLFLQPTHLQPINQPIQPLQQPHLILLPPPSLYTIL
ncbi:2-phospho-L-lactate transferase CofD family protein, partial [Staphylococcus epidermidis]|uniref:2-phospho-L-lactate transferase CofD family protein n=1 Tax=Staphylococcus epidermidis TaxID=1282 RepID=UPI0037D9DD9F